MKMRTQLVAMAFAMALFGTSWAGDEQTAVQLRIKLDLVDGSHIVGNSVIATVPVQTPYAKMDIPWSQIQTIKVGDDHETLSVDLQNGDKLTGVMALETLEIDTEFGVVAFGMQHIRKLSVIMCRGTGRNGLVLWNRLGSEGEVRNSCVGPGGMLNGGRFVQGRFNQGLELNMHEQYGVTFPAGIVSGPNGCVEFWARLLDFKDELAWGARPGLISGDDGQGAQHFMLLHLNGNDGQGNGGLCATIPELSSAGTGPYGQWTYARAMGLNTAGDWHHYAMVWASDGIPDVADGKRTVVAYVDGKLNSSVWHGISSNIRPMVPAHGRFGLLFHQGMRDGRVVYDNLKVWNYAKTDFKDRNDE